MPTQIDEPFKWWEHVVYGTLAGIAFVIFAPIALGKRVWCLRQGGHKYGEWEPSRSGQTETRKCRWCYSAQIRSVSRRT